MQEISLLYTRIYRLIEYKEYDLAFSELASLLPFYPKEDISKLDLQNLFAKYIIEGKDSLEKIIHNYSRLFVYLSAPDIEAIYQMIIYRSYTEANAERAALIVAQMANSGLSEAGIYYFLAYTFYNLRMKEQANRYLDCLITIAPHHPATSDLIFRLRGKRPPFRGEASNALKNLFYKDGSYNARITVVRNIHIPLVANSEWREIADKLFKDRMPYVRLLAYSEIPIFYAREEDDDMLYSLISDSMRENNYTLFNLVSRSLLYVHKDPERVINRIRSEYKEHPFFDILYAKYLLALSYENLNTALELYIRALSKENNFEIFMEAVELFRRSPAPFLIKAFGEELLFMYPYYEELFSLYRLISPDVKDFDRYFERMPESQDRYIIYSRIALDGRSKERYLVSGVKAFPSDCVLIIELMKVSSDCSNRGFFEIYNKELRGIIKRDELIRCLNYLDDKSKKDYISMLETERRYWCDRGKGE